MFWKPIGVNHEGPQIQPNESENHPEDSNIKYTKPSTTRPFKNLQSDAGNGGVINQERPIGGWMMEPIMETAKSPIAKYPATRQGRGTTAPTPPTNQAKGLMPKSLMRTSHPQGTPGGPNVKNTSSVVAPNHLQPLAGSPSCDGFQEHTHDTPTPGSLSRS